MKKFCSLLLVLALLFTMAVTASAATSVKLSSDKTFLHIKNADVLPEYDAKYSAVKEIYFTDCVIGEDLDSWVNGKVEKITFDNCKYYVATLSFPDSVKEIVFNKTLFSDMNFFGILSKLKKIKVYNCKMEDMGRFSKAGVIENISFNFCTIGTLKGLGGMKSLKNLSFDHTKIDTSVGIEALENLQYLSMKNSSVGDISNLKGMNIKHLNVDNCVNLESLDVLTEMPALEQLFADNCEMAATEKLISHLEDNGISSNLNRESLKIKNHVRKIYNSIIKKGMTKEEVIGTVVSYVCDNLSYDKKAESNDRLYAQYNENRLKYALAGQGVSANYATMTTALLNEAGIVCYEVEGDERVWNIVKVDGRHYWLDTAKIDDGKIKKLGDSDWFMMSGDALPESYAYTSLPSAVYLNPVSLRGDYKQTKDFLLGESISVPEPEEGETEKEEETTEERATTKEEKNDTEETTVSEVAEHITEEETTKKEKPKWYTETYIDEDEGKTMGKIIVAFFVFLAAAAGTVFIVRKYRREY